MNRFLKKFIIFNIAISALVAGFVLFSYLVKGKEGFECAFYTFTGLYCPGCGGTRALYAMLRLDILNAVRYNVAVPFGIFVYVYYNVRAVICLARKDISYFKSNRYYLCIAFAIVFIGNFIVKNLLLLCFGIRFM